jgi:hypothetical protein
MPLSTLSAIIERDSKATTYKFALLRATIDVVQESSTHAVFGDDRVFLPTGLLVEKWLLYYYPIVEAGLANAQIHGRGKLAFAEELQHLVDYYTKYANGYSSFYNDLRFSGIPDGVASVYLRLVRKLRDTIVNMPMRYIGKSVFSTEYSIYHPEPGFRFLTADRYDSAYLIESCGRFSIPLDFYESFRLLGSFVSGQSSILFKWAEFSASASEASIEHVMHHVLRAPVTERDVADSKKLYLELLEDSGKVTCVYTGKPLRSYDIDHVIPFSIWKNNDLWNLLPADKAVNNRKRNAIPTPELLERRADHIHQYWEILNERANARFGREIRSALLGNRGTDNWKADALVGLQNHCNYLIETRGCAPFTL